MLTDRSRRHLELPGEAAGGLGGFEGSQQLRPRPADEGAECFRGRRPTGLPKGANAANGVNNRRLVGRDQPFLLMISLIVAVPRDGHFGPGVYAGLIARFLLLSYLVWTTTIAGAVLHHADSRASDSSRRRFRLELENRHSRRGAGAVHRAESYGLVEESLAGSHGDRMDP